MTKKSQEPTFEEALKELEMIVARLESGQVALEEGIKFYERGVELRGMCEQKLQSSKKRIDVIAEKRGVDEFSFHTTEPIIAMSDGDGGSDSE